MSAGLPGFRFAPDAERRRARRQGAARRRRRRRSPARSPSAPRRSRPSANGDFVLAADGTLRWQGAAIARIAEGDDALKPRLILLADDALAGRPARARAGAPRPLAREPCRDAAEAAVRPRAPPRRSSPAARGIAFRLVENLGVIERTEIAEEVRAPRPGVRAPACARSASASAPITSTSRRCSSRRPAALLADALGAEERRPRQRRPAELSGLAASGRTSVPVDPAIPRPLYRVVGYRVAGNTRRPRRHPRAPRRLIRPLIAWRPTPEAPTPPDGAADGNGFTRHGRDDLAARLLRRGFRLGAPRARLPRRAPAGAAAGRCRSPAPR